MKIRTIISFYNGSQFIKEQVDSILLQSSLNEFTNEIYIYNDGSKPEEAQALESLYKKEASVKIINKANEGVLISFFKGMSDAINDKVDYLFIADQDDIFTNNKYIKHIQLHKEQDKSLIITSDNKWDPITNIKIPRRGRNHFGHNMSFDLNLFAKRSKFDITKMLDYFIEIKQKNNREWQWLNAMCHDYVWAIMQHVQKDIYATKDIVTCDWRVYSTSTSHSMLYKTPSLVLSSYYRYFYGIKPLFKNVFNYKVKIRDFNRRDRYSDDYPIGAWFKWHFDNFAMYFRIKYLRDIIHISTSKKDVKVKQALKDEKKNWDKLYLPK